MITKEERFGRMSKEHKEGTKYKVYIEMSNGGCDVLEDVDEVWFPENYATSLCIIQRGNFTDYYRMKRIKHICVEEIREEEE